MNEKGEFMTIPKGYFPIRITVGTGLVERFIEEASQRHSITIVQQPRKTDERHEEVVIAVPFADKEMLRVDFNIFAAEMEREHGMKTEFLMESSTEFMPAAIGGVSQHR